MWRNGEIYEGEFYEGLKEGFGTWKESKTGASYVGEWKRSRPNGYGIFISEVDPSKGTKYEGEWKNGLKHGPGTEQYRDSGDVYVGHFNNGKAEGEGKYIWNSGSVYEGEFR